MNMDMLQSLRSWLQTALVCVFFITLVLAATESVALFYLYSFDPDPKRWSNLTVFYARPKQAFRGRPARELAPLGALTVRGDAVRKNRGNPVYARHHELTLADIRPSALHDCLLAAEDKGFYGHNGLAYLSVAKALYDHYVDGKRLRGGSTISNQVIRTAVLADQSRSLLRKIPELLLTDVAERHFSKEDLLVAYANEVYLGTVLEVDLVGFSAAAETLFGKKYPKQLTISESCVLAGLLHGPNPYLDDALKGNYHRIINRRDVVLKRLADVFPDRYPQKLIEKTKFEEIRFKIVNKTDSDSRRLIKYAQQQVGSAKPGTHIYLTVDADLQQAAMSAVNEVLARFDRSEYGFYNQLSYRHAIKQRANATKEDSKLQATLVALDAKTGEVLAMVGGRNSAGEFNRATHAKRAPGSLIKPFVYLHGIASGSYAGQRFRADTIIDPSRHPIAERYTTGGAASATVQLARSDNGAAVSIAQEFGISRVRQFVTKTTGATPVESELIAIGGGKGIELSPLQVAVAYTIFSNNGVKMVPKSIFAAYDDDMKFEAPERKPARVVDAQAAIIVARMLQSVIGDGPDGHYGTASMARTLSGLGSRVALAGKTGTGDNDLWFVGFTPRLVMVVWVGFDHNYPRLEMAKGFTGSGLPLQIWARFMRGVKKYRPELLEGKFEGSSDVRELAFSRNTYAK